MPTSGTTKSKETTLVQEFVAPPSEESKAGAPTDSGKPAAARVKPEPKAVKQEPVTPPEMTSGKPTATVPASQVTYCFHWNFITAFTNASLAVVVFSCFSALSSFKKKS